VSGDSTKRRDKVQGRSVTDKVRRQSVETRCEDKVWEMFCHRAAKGERSAFTL